MNSGKQDIKGSWGQENMTSGDQEATSPRFQQGLSSRFQDFLKPGHQDLLRSGLHDLWSSRVQELMISGHQGFLTSRDQDAKTPRRQDFNPYWFPDITISWWIEFKSYSSRFSAVLFPMSASGTGSSPLQIGRRTSGNGTWYSTRFWVPGTLYVSGLSKLCFPLREIDFVTENSLPARGLKTPPESSFFTGHPMCQHRFSIDLEFSSVPTWVLLPENSFLRLVAHKKRGESRKIFPVKRYFDFNNVANKMLDKRLVLGIIPPY